MDWPEIKRCLIGEFPGLLGLRIAIALHFSLLLVVGLSRHWGYMSSINDLGVFDQTVWNTLHGNVLQTTINPFGRSINWLGFHFQPILLLFVPLYGLSPAVQWFALAQAAALSGAAWPLYLLARHIFQSKETGVMWAVVYLLNPFLLSAGAWDFHPITLTVPFMALGLLAVVKKRIRMLVFACLLILCCKEHLGLSVVGFGALWWLRHREWKTALAIVALGLIPLALVLGLVMPQCSPIGTPVMLSEQMGQLSRYSWLGNSLTEVFYTLMSQPFSVWMKVIEMGGVMYWTRLIVPFLCVFPLLGIEFLLPGLGDLAANTLSANPMPRSILAYHSVAVVPLLVTAAAVGIKRISTWHWQFSAQVLTGFVLAASLLFGYVFLPVPLPGALNMWAPNHFLNWPASEVEAIRETVGATASVSVQANVGPHFSQRQEIYLYPHKVGEVDVIILRLASPTTKINNFPGPSKDNPKSQFTLLDGHLQMDRVDYLASIECLLAEGEYGVELWADPWLVLSKTTAGYPSVVVEKTGQLREEWQVTVGEYQQALKNCQVN